MTEGILHSCLSQKGERRAEEGISWGKGFSLSLPRLFSWKGLVRSKPGIVLRQRLEAKSLCRSEPVFSVCLSFLSVVKEKQLKIRSSSRAVSVPMVGALRPRCVGCPSWGLQGDLGAAGRFQQGLGMCHWPLGRLLQLRTGISAVSPHLAFVLGTGLWGRVILKGVFKRLFLRHPKWTGTILPGQTSLVDTDRVKGLEKCLVMQL